MAQSRNSATSMTHPRLSYAILLHREVETFQKLIEQLYSVPHAFEVRVVLDGDDPEILRMVRDYETKKPHFHVYQRALNKNFSAQRNFIGKKCEGDYIVRIDADELMPQEILENIDHYLNLFDEKEYDAIWMPRINFTGEIPKDVIQRDRLKMNDRGWVNFPDMQLKIYKNASYLSWTNTVHERLLGAKTVYEFPPEEAYAIWHDKPAASLMASNDFYRTFHWRYWEKLKKSIDKRLRKFYR